MKWATTLDRAMIRWQKAVSHLDDLQRRSIKKFLSLFATDYTMTDSTIPPRFSACSSLAGGNYLMWPISVDGSQANNYLFSPQSQSSVRAVIAAKGGCFKDPDEDICGNGVQEGNEACDCGAPSGCASIDACCSTSGDCTLRTGAQYECR